ncbi:MAG: response regulator [Herpetosiphonaceae bacterium]|nr:response regulator [Herpetosiphonaceae bacterium]
MQPTHTVANHRSRRFFWLLGIQAGLVVILLVSAAIMSISITRIRSTDEKQLAYRLIVNDVNLDLLAAQSSLRGYISTGSPTILDPYRTKTENIQRNLEFLEVEAPHPEQLEAIQRGYQIWNSQFAERAIALVQAGTSDEAQALIASSGQQLFDPLISQVEQLRLTMRGESQARNNQVGLINWIQFGNFILLTALLSTSSFALLHFWGRERGLIGELQLASQELATSNAELHLSTAEQRRINQQLRARISESRLINIISDKLNENLPTAVVYNFIAQQIGDFLGGWCSISLRCPAPHDDLLDVPGLYHPDPDRLQALAAWVSQQEARADQGIHAPLFTNQESVVILQVPPEVRRPANMDPSAESIVDVINLVSYIGVPITGPQRVIGVLGVASSTEDRYFDAEQELFLTQIADQIAAWIENTRLFQLAEQRANELQISFDSITDIITTYDKAGKKIRMNKSGRIFLGSTSLDALAPELVWRKPNGQVLAVDEHPVQRALRGETVADVELAIPRWDGQIIVHTVSVAPLRSADGQFGGAVLVARDITARKELERLKEELVANMSHELRTPLTAILGYSELLLKRRAEHLTTWHISKLEGIRTGGQRLLALVNDLLDIAKLDAGHVELHCQPSRISQILHTQLAALQPMMLDKQQQLTLHLAPQLPIIAIDPERIGQVIINLLSNAIKFTPNQGAITISSGHVALDHAMPPQWLSPPLEATLPEDLSGQFLVVNISDTGVGIPAAAMPHLWDRFYQAEGGSTRRFGGTGLGLSIVQQLIDLHHGKVWASSAGEDQGSTFTFILPVDTANPPLIEAHSTQESTILVIENARSTAEEFGAHLRQAGFNVVIAHSAQEALEWAATGQPTAITLDLLHPQSDGWEILAALRQLPHLADTPVVIASTQNAPIPRQSLAVSTYLVKPIGADTLIQVIQQLLGTASTRSQAHILIVDDDTDMAELVGATLQEHGYQTQTAYDGSIALDMLRSGELPSLILLDLMMPIVDGFQLLARLRDDPATQHIPVIIVTARDLSNEEIKQLRSAAQGIQAKHTLNMNTLVAEVQRHVALKKAEDHE